jgi:hypothetical protein
VLGHPSEKRPGRLDIQERSVAEASPRPHRPGSIQEVKVAPCPDRASQDALDGGRVEVLIPSRRRGRSGKAVTPRASFALA